MKFITEADLRQIYKQEEFAHYIVPQNSRITPDAKQFLMDRHIQISYEGERRNDANLIAKGSTIVSTDIQLCEEMSIEIEEIEAKLFLLKYTMDTCTDKMKIISIFEKWTLLKRIIGGEKLDIPQLEIENKISVKKDFSLLQYDFAIKDIELVSILADVRITLRKLLLSMEKIVTESKEVRLYISYIICCLEDVISGIGGKNNGL